jgi:hypothetical protein
MNNAFKTYPVSDNSLKDLAATVRNNFGLHLTIFFGIRHTEWFYCACSVAYSALDASCTAIEFVDLNVERLLFAMFSNPLLYI